MLHRRLTPSLLQLKIMHIIVRQPPCLNRGTIAICNLKGILLVAINDIKAGYMDVTAKLVERF